MSDAFFLRLLTYNDKSSALVSSINATEEGRTLNTVVHVVDPTSFSQIPGSTFAYWVSERMRRIFTELPALEGEGKAVKSGLTTRDDFRFVRLWYEVEPDKTVRNMSGITSEAYQRQTFQGKRWVPFAKGGAYSPYYSDLHLVINWEQDGEDLKNFRDPQGKPLSFLRNPESYFHSGLTWSRRSQRGLSVRILPTGCIFSDKGPVIFTNSNQLLSLLGVVNSVVFQALVALQMAFGSYEVGVIQRTPYPHLLGSDAVKLSKLVLQCVNMKRDVDRANETSHIFHLPALLYPNGNTLADRVEEWQKRVSETEQQLAEFQHEIDEIAFRLYNLEGEDRLAIEESLGNVKSEMSGETEAEDEENTIETSSDSSSLVAGLISYFTGCIYSRWDVRFALEDQPIPALPDLFVPLPVCSSGMLKGDDGLPLFETPLEYPLEINWEGILIDDQDHPGDIVKCVQHVLKVIWQDCAESIEQEACQILAIKELREYFRKPGNGGFWLDHVKRYSKSRRKAPIYWLLQSSKKNYALWLYYHRLDKDTLFKA